MTVQIKYKAQNYRNQREGDRFVRADRHADYVWCIRDALDLRYDIQQGTCNADDLPDDIRKAADALMGRAFGYVKWPR